MAMRRHEANPSPLTRLAVRTTTAEAVAIENERP
jgi:hypothetical protein